MSTASPLPPKQLTTVKGHRFAHVEMGRGHPMVILHGNPTSSYLWRDVMPPLASRGRVIVPDLIGHGDLPASEGPGRYTLKESLGNLGQLTLTATKRSSGSPTGPS